MWLSSLRGTKIHWGVRVRTTTGRKERKENFRDHVRYQRCDEGSEETWVFSRSFLSLSELLGLSSSNDSLTKVVLHDSFP